MKKKIFDTAVILMMGSFIGISMEDALDLDSKSLSQWVEPNPSFQKSIPSQYEHGRLLPYFFVFNTTKAPNCQHFLGDFLKDCTQSEDNFSSSLKFSSNSGSSLSSKLGCFNWGQSNNTSQYYPSIDLGQFINLFAVSRTGTKKKEEFPDDIAIKASKEMGLLGKVDKTLNEDLDLLLQTYNWMGLTQNMITSLGYETEPKELSNKTVVLVFKQKEKVNSKKTSTWSLY